MYNPFIKGKLPVGVRTIELAGIDNKYTTEIWYPAADEYSGVEAIDTFKFVDELPAATQDAVRDAAPADGKRPLIIYWHGGYGHRREMAAMCVLLASHGFAVAAPDFPGDHITKMYGSDPEITRTPVDSSAEARPAQAAEVIELLIGSADAFLSSTIDGDNVGSFGLSLGGFTTIAVNTTSPRLKASFAIAPACGTRSPLPQMVRIARLLHLEDWKSPSSTFVLTGEVDALVIEDDVRELFLQLPAPKRLAVLKKAGHLHWADNAELMHETLRLRYLSGEFPDPEIDGPKVGRAFRPFSELCSAEDASAVMRSTIVAHFEANLNRSDDARSFLEDDLAATFAERGIDLEVSEKHPSYDPFERGKFPVGVRTLETTKEEPRSGRKLTVEVWYPATEEYRGKDTAEVTMDRFAIAPGLPELTQEAVRNAVIESVERLPLIMYFHGGYGFRRELANVATNLASHGYIVAAPDFPGDGIAELQLTKKKDDAQTFAPDEAALVRPHQASFVISSLISDSEFSTLIDPDKIGTFGFSMGGFTSLGLNSIDTRPKASVAIAPLYGENDLVKSMARTQKQLSVDDWGREVPTFLVGGELDSFVRLKALRALDEELLEPKSFVILRGAGHFHWTSAGEQVHELFRSSFLSGAITDPEFDAKGMAEAMRPFAELAPAWHAADTARAFCLAHFDRNLKRIGDAEAFLNDGLNGTFERRGIDVEVRNKRTSSGVAAGK